VIEYEQTDRISIPIHRLRGLLCRAHLCGVVWETAYPNDIHDIGMDKEIDDLIQYILKEVGYEHR
jgi:hypothetical protein